MNRWLKVAGGAAGVILVYVGLWVSLLVSSDPLNHALVSWPIFPVMCTTRGCVASTTWLRQHELTRAFNESSQQSPPAPEQTLTTVIRKHLVENAFLRSPVGAEDVARYREDILHATSDEDVRQHLPLSLAEYDELVLAPFLQQEALRFQHKVESTEELYRLLTNERPIFILLFKYQWSAESGKAQTR